MTDIQNHPDVEQLLLLVDEGTPTRANRWVRRHVAACWKCRSHLEELEETVREFARYHEKALLPNLPAPPKPWPDLRTRMRLVDEAIPLPDLWRRAAAYMSLPAMLSLKRLMIGGIVFSCVALAVTLALRSGKHADPVGPGVSRAPEPVVAPTVAPTVAPAATPTVAPVTPNRAATVAPAVPSPADTEVRIFAALHRIDADLGDPIEISSDGKGHFKVIGIGLALPRQAEVRDALASLPDVAVDFPQANPAGGSRGSNSRALHFEAGRSPFEAPLQRFLGGQAEWENYANQVLDESDAVLERAHALRTLADHFPAAKRAELQERERAMLDEIFDAHRDALREHAGKLEALVAPVREALHAPPVAAAKAGEGPLVPAERMDRVLSVIFGVASTNLTPAQLIVELSQASGELQGALGNAE
jgi:hypothetical protein